MKSVVLVAASAASGVDAQAFTSANAADAADGFSVVKYRRPKQCERNQCLAEDSEYCIEHLPGFYRRERGPQSNEDVCSDCEYPLSESFPTNCRAESKPFEIFAKYGDQCDASKVCGPGQGECFRPCETYLHPTHCPNDKRCAWDEQFDVCSTAPRDPVSVAWNADWEISMTMVDDVIIGDTIRFDAAGSYTQEDGGVVHWAIEDTAEVTGKTSSGKYAIKLTSGVHVEAEATDVAKESFTVVHKVMFPLLWSQFVESATGFMLYDSNTGNAVRLEALINLEMSFIKLDHDGDGKLNELEFREIPAWLVSLKPLVEDFSEQQVNSWRRLYLEEHHNWTLPDMPSIDYDPETTTPHEDLVRRLGEHEAARRLESFGAIPWGTAHVKTPKQCKAKQQFHCGLTSQCAVSCLDGCSWRSAHNLQTNVCERPSPATCRADNDQIFCAHHKDSEIAACVEKGACHNCHERLFQDDAKGSCEAAWWRPIPSDKFQNWICRFRNKVGMKCHSDQDCIYGSRKCKHGVNWAAGIPGKCEGLATLGSSTAESELIDCTVHYDCPHVGYYCQTDPAEKANIYFRQVCRPQNSPGSKCGFDVDCMPDSKCNHQENTFVCRRMFSVEIGLPVSHENLCVSGWTDKTGKCADAPKSKNVGMSCQEDTDCATTDATGRTGECACKNWWEAGDSKICMPVIGDFYDEASTYRTWLSHRATHCGSFWTEEECLEQTAEGPRIFYTYMCEKQLLYGGPHRPASSCRIPEEELEKDYCKMLTDMGHQLPITITRTKGRAYLDEKGSAFTATAATAAFVAALAAFL